MMISFPQCPTLSFLRKQESSIIKTLSIALLIITLTACSQTSKHSGGNIKLSQYQGRWVLINYWATWCKPCLHEMPALNKLYQNHSKKVMVLGISYDNLSSSEMNAVSKKYAIQYPLLTSFPLSTLGIKQISVLPITFIINPQGKLVKTLRGPQTEKQFATAVGINPPTQITSSPSTKTTLSSSAKAGDPEKKRRASL